MKTRTIGVSILSLGLVLSSCQKIKDALTVTVKTDFTVNMPVTTAPSPLKSTLATFSATKQFDPLSNADLAKYKDKIKTFDLTSMTGTVTDLSSDVTLTDATLVVSTGTNSTEWHFTNLALTNGTVVTFDNSGSQWAKINSILLEQAAITVVFSGTANQTNVTFTLVVKFGTDVVARIL